MDFFFASLLFWLHEILQSDWLNIWAVMITCGDIKFYHKSKQWIINQHCCFQQLCNFANLRNIPPTFATPLRVPQFDLIFKYLNQIFDQIQIQIWLYLIWSNSNLAKFDLIWQIFDLIWKLLLKIQIQIKFKFKYLNQIKFKSGSIWFDQIQIDPIFDLIWI